MARRSVGALAFAVFAAAIGLALASQDDHQLEGRDAGGGRHVPGVQAAFELESYKPGSRARLVVEDRSRHLTIQIFRSGPEHVATTSDTVMNGVPASSRKAIARRPGTQSLSIPVGNWKSGLYFARLDAPDRRVGFAPFVVAPSRIGAHRVAVVFPTLTWQAYNFRDDDGAVSRTPGTPERT